MEQVRHPIKFTPPKRISPKLVEFARWSQISNINAMIDDGQNLTVIYKWVTNNGFSISLPMFQDYARLRRKSLISGISMNHLLGVAGKPAVDHTSPEVKTARDKLKSEIDALDAVIQRGYDTLKSNPDAPVTPLVMMSAIKLKNELTDGQHGFLTNYGMEHLRDIENGKYKLIIDHLISYIPEDRRQEAVSKILDIEDAYYQSTDYYEEYLRASDLTETEIGKRLEIWKENRNTTVIDTLTN